MKKIKITAMRKACYSDLMETYENPMNMPVTFRKDKFGLPMDGRNRMDCVTAHGRACRPL